MTDEELDALERHCDNGFAVDAATAWDLIAELRTTRTELAGSIRAYRDLKNQDNQDAERAEAAEADNAILAALRVIADQRAEAAETRIAKAKAAYDLEDDYDAANAMFAALTESNPKDTDA